MSELINTTQTLMDLTNLYQAATAEIYMTIRDESDPETRLDNVARILKRLEHELRTLKNLHSGVALSDG